MGHQPPAADESSTALPTLPLSVASAQPAIRRLKPTHRPLWRGESSVQLGLEPARSLVLTGVTARTAQLLRELDRGPDSGTGTGTGTGQGIGGGGAAGGMGSTGEALLALLGSAGALDHPPGPTEARLAPERAMLGLLHPAAGAADAVLAARAATRLLVVGGGRTGATLAHLLAASGLGRVTVEDRSPVEPADACPAGVSSADVGLRRGAAATALSVRAAPPVLNAGPPAVAVFCPEGPTPPDPARWWPLLAAGTALLVASVRESTGVVGPFTPPWGRCCPGCISLHRADRDPAWPLLERQLADPRRVPAGTAAAVTVLAVAAAAAEQVLSWVDSGASDRPRRPPATAGATLELPRPGWQWYRRAWGAHPACRCAKLEAPAS
jgi:hypothetical protein